MTLETGPGHERWEDASGAYLLGALPPDEAEGYAAHLAVCPACRAEVEELEPAANALPASAIQVPAPAAVGRRVMAEVRREAQLLAAAGSGADRAAAPAPAPARARRAWWHWPVPALAAAALLLGLAVGLGAMGVIGNHEKRVEMAATGAARGAHAWLVLQGDRATLEADHLPAPSGGRVYQVWLKPRGKAPEPTRSLFVPRTDGHAVVAVPAEAKDMEAVLVTAEPGGGSLAPTSAPVLSAAVT